MVASSMVYFTSSQRNRPLLHYDGHKYRIKKTSRDGVIWVCTTDNCTAMIKSNLEYSTNNAFFNIISNHNHLNDIQNEVRDFYYDKMKDLASSTEIPTRQILQGVLRGAPENIIVAMGGFETLYRTLRNIRERNINPQPYLITELCLSEILTKTYLNDQFYRYGPQKYDELLVDDNILMFYSD